MIDIPVRIQPLDINAMSSVSGRQRLARLAVRDSLLAVQDVMRVRFEDIGVPYPEATEILARLNAVAEAADSAMVAPKQQSSLSYEAVKSAVAGGSYRMVVSRKFSAEHFYVSNVPIAEGIWSGKGTDKRYTRFTLIVRGLWRADPSVDGEVIGLFKDTIEAEPAVRAWIERVVGRADTRPGGATGRGTP